MALTKEAKSKILDKLKEKIDKHKSMVFVSIAGLKTKDTLEFRTELKENDCNLSVVKKTLLGIALKDKKIDVDVKSLEGEVAIVFGFEDEISPARISNKIARKNDNLKILSGVFEKEFITKEKVLELAQIPSRIELLGRFVGTIKAPVNNFVHVLNGNIKGLLYVLSNINK